MATNIIRKKIKVLFVIDYYYSPFGGTEKQLYTLIHNLNKEKFYVELCLLRRFSFDEDYFNKNPLPCKKNIIKFQKYSRLKDWINLFKLRKYIIKNKFDIVQLLFNDAALTIPFICAGTGIKTVTCRRDMGFWYTKIKLAILRINSLFVDMYLVNSKAVKNNVMENEKVKETKITVIYNAHDLNQFNLPKLKEFHKKNGIPERARIIGIVANYRPVKRINDIIKAFPDVVNKLPNCYLVLVGDFYDQKRKCIELAEKLGIDNKVRFLGKIDNVIPIIKNFSIGVNCSESEGLSNVIIEYMGCGVPVICSDNPGNRELAGNDRAILYPVGNVQSLAGGIVKLLGNEKIRKCLVANAKRFVKEVFVTEKVIKTYEQFYTNLSLVI